MRATVTTPTTMIARHNIRMKYGYLIAKLDMTRSRLLRLRPVGGRKDRFFRPHHLTRLIAAQITDDYFLAFLQTGNNFDIPGTFDPKLHIASLNPVLIIDDEYTGVVFS